MKRTIFILATLAFATFHSTLMAEDKSDLIFPDKAQKICLIKAKTAARCGYVQARSRGINSFRACFTHI